MISIDKESERTNLASKSSSGDQDFVEDEEIQIDSFSQVQKQFFESKNASDLESDLFENDLTQTLKNLVLRAIHGRLFYDKCIIFDDRQRGQLQTRRRRRQ
ncbi:hypothetical protein BpHYR1_002740 [Brachionus plicatilis]|uniref:Uncharacterized protein n=1 Tax=Brachionus plicatilis TaxID=10195 RepID=A0A3M7PLM7_BRAPC|nr:hypothetical protein BpHYR1_002740 [Brachionus plicatilis]